MNVTVTPPGQTGQGTVEVTVTVVVGHVGHDVVAVGYGHGPVGDRDAGVVVGPLLFGPRPFVAGVQDGMLVAEPPSIISFIPTEVYQAKLSLNHRCLLRCRRMYR